MHIFERTFFDAYLALVTIDIRLHSAGRQSSAQQEDIMIKPLVTATLFALGGAGVALVGYLATEPLAFTSPVRELPPISPEPSPAIVPASVPITVEAGTSSILLAEVQITAVPPSATKQPVLPAQLAPCTEWRHVGVLVVDHGIAVGVRNVRVLCTESSDDAKGGDEH